MTRSILKAVAWFLISTQITYGATNIILIIPDGMPLSALAAARAFSGRIYGKLNMNLLPNSAYASTYCADSWITDSAAAGTALATGKKTDSGVISEDSTAVRSERHGAPLETILERCEEKGMATGVVTTTRITHTTPAVFYAHWYERDEENEIALQMLDAGMEVILGGGRRHFLPEAESDPETGQTGRRTDNRNLIQEFVDRNYTYVWNEEQFDGVPTTTEKLLGLFNYSHMEFELDRPEEIGGEPSLAELTDKALQILAKDPDGFFLMVEGGRIDHAGHANDPDRWLYDLIACDLAVGVARDFAQTHPNTLIIVVPDHGTGGPASIGWYDNLTDSTVTTYEGFPDYKDTDNDGYPDNTPTRPIAIGWASSPFFTHETDPQANRGRHIADDVPVMAAGPHSELIHGFIDNTYIFEVMATSLGVAETTPLRPAQKLLSVSPNPSGRLTQISYELPISGPTSLKIYDASGRVVRILVDEWKPEGSYRLSWDGVDERGNPLPSGVYFCHLKIGERDSARKVIRLR
jgi:alkaline phosphatase